MTEQKDNELDSTEEISEIKTSVPSIANEIDTFVRNLDAIATSLPLIMLMMSRANESVNEKQFKYLERYGTLTNEEGEIRRYNLSASHISGFNSLERKAKQLDIGSSILPCSFIVSLISQYDFFLGRIIRALYYLRPDAVAP